MDFWDRVKKEIHSQNTTQEWVSRNSGIKFSTFRGWITKEIMPNADQAVAIAECLKTSVEYLVTGVPSDSIPPHLRDLFEDLQVLSEQNLADVKHMAHRWAEEARVKAMPPRESKLA